MLTILSFFKTLTQQHQDNLFSASVVPFSNETEVFFLPEICFGFERGGKILTGRAGVTSTKSDGTERGRERERENVCVCECVLEW